MLVLCAHALVSHEDGEATCFPNCFLFSSISASLSDLRLALIGLHLALVVVSSDTPRRASHRITHACDYTRLRFGLVAVPLAFGFSNVVALRVLDARRCNGGAATAESLRLHTQPHRQPASPLKSKTSRLACCTCMPAGRTRSLRPPQCLLCFCWIRFATNMDVSRNRSEQLAMHCWVQRLVV